MTGGLIDVNKMSRENDILKGRRKSKANSNMNYH